MRSPWARPSAGKLRLLSRVWTGRWETTALFLFVDDRWRDAPQRLGGRNGARYSTSAFKHKRHTGPNVMSAASRSSLRAPLLAAGIALLPLLTGCNSNNPNIRPVAQDEYQDPRTK